MYCKELSLKYQAHYALKSLSKLLSSGPGPGPGPITNSKLKKKDQSLHYNPTTPTHPPPIIKPSLLLCPRIVNVKEEAPFNQDT